MQICSRYIGFKTDERSGRSRTQVLTLTARQYHRLHRALSDLATQAVSCIRTVSRIHPTALTFTRSTVTATVITSATRTHNNNYIITIITRQPFTRRTNISKSVKLVANRTMVMIHLVFLFLYIRRSLDYCKKSTLEIRHTKGIRSIYDHNWLT